MNGLSESLTRRLKGALQRKLLMLNHGLCEEERRSLHKKKQEGEDGVRGDGGDGGDHGRG